MTFNMMGFVLSDIIARNRGVRRGTALRDGLLGGILGARSPMLAVVLTSVISQNQESSRSVGARPTLTGVTSTTPGQLTINGSNFGTDPTVITVTFGWQVGSPPLRATETVPLPSCLVTGTLSPSSFTMTVPPNLPSSPNMSMVVTVNGAPSNTFSFQTGTPALITATSGTTQSATVNRPFALPLQATVTDILGNLLQGISVTFTAPPAGTLAGGTFANGANTAATTTNASGMATAPTFTANGTATVPGAPYTVTATVAGVTTPATYALTNTST